MNFFKQAQEFAASANTETDGNNNSTAPGASDGGFGSFMGQATNMLKSQGGAPADNDGSDAPASLPGGRQAPTNQELMQSGKLLFGAAQGQKVDPTKLAGAASDLLGGLAAHGNLDEGTYGTYINQAEDYLNKYSGQGQSGAGAGAGAARPARPSQADSDQVPTDESDAPPRQRTADDQSDGFQSPADQTDADSAPVNARPSTNDYAPDQQRPARPSASASDDQY